jgi:hypothetical protein
MTDCAQDARSNMTSSKPSLTSVRRLYLAGPIRGIDDFKDRFDYAAGQLRGEGFTIFNPVEQDDFFSLVGMPNDVALYLEHDLAWVCRWAEGIALLRGWERSDGAQAEYYAARACGKRVWILPDEYQLS